MAPVEMGGGVIQAIRAIRVKRWMNVVMNREACSY
jgi:hypothetical protein